MTSIPLCTVGTKGFSIVCNAGGFYLIGYTCTLLASPGNQTAPEANQTLGEGLSPMTLSSDDLSAIYVTSGAEFEAAGLWTLWLKAINADTGQVLISPPALVYVFPAPAIAA